MYNIFFPTANAVITCPICRAPGNRWSVQAYQVLALLPTWDIYKTTLAPGAEAPKKTVAEIIWQDEENEQRGEWVDVNANPWDRLRELDWKANDKWFNFDSRFY